MTPENESSIHLELNKEEADLVDRIFKHYLPELRDEVYHTDSHDFREALEVDEEVLKRLMTRLNALQAEHGAAGR